MMAASAIKKIVAAVAAGVAAYILWLLFYGMAMFSYLNPPSFPVQVARWLSGFVILFLIPYLSKNDGRFDFFLSVFFVLTWLMSIVFCLSFLPLTIVGQEHFSLENKHLETFVFFLLPLMSIYYAGKRVDRYKQIRSAEGRI
jgi:hypothetical protein